jgi:purine-binding chemotaxis protein CheW
MPNRYDATKSKYTEFVVLAGRDWAIACDDLVKSIRVPESEINWNTDKADRPWLLGTYMRERCAIIDVPALLELFEQAF